MGATRDDDSWESGEEAVAVVHTTTVAGVEMEKRGCIWTLCWTSVHLSWWWLAAETEGVEGCLGSDIRGWRAVLERTKIERSRGKQGVAEGWRVRSRVHVAVSGRALGARMWSSRKR